MKMLMLIEVEVSKATAETIQRTGFELAPNGAGLQVKVANSPLPRKTKMRFVNNPKLCLDDISKIAIESQE